MIRSKNDLRPYQNRMTDFQIMQTSPACWVGMGLGKTVATLEAISTLLHLGILNAVLVVAPIRVCHIVWAQEAAKWEHTRHLRFSRVMGDKDTRVRALLRPADVYLINYENLGWLAEVLHHYYVAKGVGLPFEGIVWDEISKMKNSSTARVRSVRNILPRMKWLTGLTGTPAGNGYKDLFGQYLVLDQGARLGTSKTVFEGRFYKTVGLYKQELMKDSEGIIKKLIGDITLEMSEEEYNPLPKMIVNDILVQMPPDTQKGYDSLEDDLFFRLDNGQDIEVFNAASLVNKLLQYSNGAVYPVSGAPEWERIHDLKLDALDEVLEEAAGQPVLCSYSYRSDAARIMERFKDRNPINLTECKSAKSLEEAMTRWKSGDCSLMIGHPASMGHGVDGLQDTCNILVWFGLNWSLDLYLQFNARVRRQGQARPVICHRILCQSTMDMVQATTLREKDDVQTSLKNAIRDYRKEKGR